MYSKVELIRNPQIIQSNLHVKKQSNKSYL